MRALGVVLLSLWAPPLWADATAPGTEAPPAPVCKRGEWKRIGSALGRFCARHREHEQDCFPYALAFRDCEAGEALGWRWIGRGWEVGFEDALNGIDLYLTVVRERGGWKVTGIRGVSRIPTPPIELEPR